MIKSIFNEIDKINRLRSGTRLWRYRNKTNPIYREKKKLQDKLYHEKNKHKRKYHYIQRRNLRIQECLYCNKEFIPYLTDKFCCRRHKMRFHGKIRNARLKTHYHLFNYRQWNKKLKKSKGICNLCDEFIGINKLTLDHIIPLSKAPQNFKYSINDVQPLCMKCNQIKNNKM